MENNQNYGIFKYLPMTIGIGNNPSSEFLGIEFMSSDHYRIVISPLIGLDKIDHIEIGQSFTDFFIRLDNGIGWFDSIKLKY